MSGREHSVEEQAARWYLRMTDGAPTRGDVETFERWLTEDGAHRAAFGRTVRELGKVDLAKATPDLSELSDLARRNMRRMGAARHRRHALAALAAALLAIVGGVTMIVLRETPATHERFASAIGERRHIVLRDGTRLSLDSGTRVEVSYSADRRSVALMQGQARFRVAHDSDRPFAVSVAGQRVVATGTDFNVERLNRQTVVTLLQGGVAIEPAREEGLLERVLPRQRSTPGVRLKPGQRIAITDGGTAYLRRVDPLSAVSWERGTLIFNDEPLAVAVQRFNRSNRVQLLLSDPDVGRVSISGTFAVADPATFASAAGQFLSIPVGKQSPETIYLGRHPQPEAE